MAFNLSNPGFLPLVGSSQIVAIGAYPNFNSQVIGVPITPFTPTGNGNSFAVVAGQLPDGVNLNPTTGEISGAPTAAALKAGANGLYTGIIIEANGVAQSPPFSFEVVGVALPVPNVYSDGDTVLSLPSGQMLFTGSDLVSFTNNNLVGHATGIISNQALDFESSSNQYLDDGGAVAKDTSLTFATTFRLESFATGGDRRCLVTQGSGPSSFSGWGLQVQQSGDERLRWFYAGSGSETAVGSTQISLGTDYNAVGVLDGAAGEMSLYVDGILDEENSSVSHGLSYSSNDLEVGRHSFFGARYFDGLQEDIALWRGVQLDEFQAATVAWLSRTGQTLSSWILGAAPTAFSYANQGPFNANQPITPFSPDTSPTSPHTLTYFAYDELPTGLSVDPNTGEISGTPTAAVGGTYRIAVTDGMNLTVSAPFDIEIITTLIYNVSYVGTNTATLELASGGTQDVTGVNDSSVYVSRVNDIGLTNWAALLETTSTQVMQRTDVRSTWMDPADDSVVVAFAFESASPGTMTPSLYNADGSLAVSFSTPIVKRLGLWTKYDKDGNYLWHAYANRNGGSQPDELRPSYMSYDSDSGLLGLAVAGESSSSTSWISDTFADGTGVLTTWNRSLARSHSFIAWVNTTTGALVSESHLRSDADIGGFFSGSGRVTGRKVALRAEEASGGIRRLRYSREFESNNELFRVDTQPVGESQWVESMVLLTLDDDLYVDDAKVMWADTSVSPFRGRLILQGVVTTDTHTLVVGEDRNQSETVAADNNYAGEANPEADFSDVKPAVPSGIRRGYVYAVNEVTREVDWVRGFQDDDHRTRVLWADSDTGTVLVLGTTTGDAILNIGEADQATVLNTNPAGEMVWLAALDVTNGDLLWSTAVQPLGAASEIEALDTVVVDGRVLLSVIVVGDGADFGSSNTASRVGPDTLLALRLDEASNTDVPVDATGNYTWTITGTPEPTPGLYAVGTSTGARDFNGSSERAEASADATARDLFRDPGSGGFTVEAWFQPDTVSGGVGVILSIQGTHGNESEGNNVLFSLAQDDDEIRVFTERGSGTNEARTTTGAGIVAGETHHLGVIARPPASGTAGRYDLIIIVRNATAGTYFREEFVDVREPTGGSNADWHVGDDGSGSEEFDGRLDDIRVTSVALDEEAIRWTYLTAIANTIFPGSDRVQALARYDLATGALIDVTQTATSSAANLSFLGYMAAPSVHDIPVPTPVSIPDPVFYARGEAFDTDRVIDAAGMVVGDARNITQVAGNTGQALRLDRSSTSRVNFGKPPNLDFGAGEFTVMAHVNTTRFYGNAFTDEGTVFVNGAIGGSQRRWWLALRDDSSFFSIDDDTTLQEAISTSSNFDVTDGNWHTLIGVRDNTNQRIAVYVDGNQTDTDGIGSYGNIDDANDPAYIGAINNGGSPERHFDGDVDEVAAWDVLLTEKQLAELNKLRRRGQSLASVLRAAPPTAFSYLDQAGFDVGVPITPFTPDVLPTSADPLTYFAYDELPEGLSLDPATGEISGTPTRSGTADYRIGVSDGLNITVSSPFEIEVVPTQSLATAGGFRNNDALTFNLHAGGTQVVNPVPVAAGFGGKMNPVSQLYDWVSHVEITNADIVDVRTPFVDPVDGSIIFCYRIRDLSAPSTYGVSIYDGSGALATPTFNIASSSGSGSERRWSLWIKYDEDGNYLWHAYATRSDGVPYQEPNNIVYDPDTKSIGLGSGVFSSNETWSSVDFVDGQGTTQSISRSGGNTLQSYIFVNAVTGAYEKAYAWTGDIGGTLPNDSRMYGGDWFPMGTLQNGFQTNTTIRFRESYPSGTVYGSLDPRLGGSGFNQSLALVGDTGKYSGSPGLIVAHSDTSSSPFYGELRPRSAVTSQNKVCLTAWEQNNNAVFVRVSEDHQSGLLQSDFSVTQAAFNYSGTRTQVFMLDKSGKTCDWVRAIDSGDGSIYILHMDEDEDIVVCGADSNTNVIASVGEVDEATLLNAFPGSTLQWIAAYRISTGALLWLKGIQPDTGTGSISSGQGQGATAVNEDHLIVPVFVEGQTARFGAGEPGVTTYTPAGNGGAVLASFDLATGDFQGLVEVGTGNSGFAAFRFSGVFEHAI